MTRGRDREPLAGLIKNDSEDDDDENDGNSIISKIFKQAESRELLSEKELSKEFEQFTGVA